MDFIVEVWEKAPMINKVIMGSMLVMSVWSIYVMIERGVTFFKGSRQSYRYVLALRDYLSKHQVVEAISWIGGLQARIGSARKCGPERCG